MNFSTFTFVLTDDCNFDCSYCRQKKEKKYLEPASIEKAVSFFYPFWDEETSVVFYGGEPMLAFDTVQYTVSLLREKNREARKKINYSITTNGSLLSDEMLRFFDRHRFILMLSFDGAAQDISRKSGSADAVFKLIRRIQRGEYPRIVFSTNSVFTPGTVEHMSETLQSIIEAGVKEVKYSLAVDQPWDESAVRTLENELRRVSRFLAVYYKENGAIPLVEFRQPETVSGRGFFCLAGRDRMAVTPEEHLWGCCLFHDFLRGSNGGSDFDAYSFGTLDDFIRDHDTVYPAILENYALLRQDCFQVDEQHCFLCEDVGRCRVCPVRAARTGSFIGRLPSWICRLNQVRRHGKIRFLEEINGPGLAV